jgi:methionine-rich copper-binding protein CopC
MVALIVASRPAAAHTELISTTPADQQTVSRAPAAIVLTFDESVLAMGTQVVVTGPQGPVQVGAPEVTDSTVSQNVQGGSPAGQYTVAWRVTAADGHPLSGTFGFTAEEASEGRPATPAAIEARSSDDASSTGISIWIWILGGIALVVVLAGVTRQLTRRTDSSAPS